MNNRVRLQVERSMVEVQGADQTVHSGSSRMTGTVFFMDGMYSERHTSIPNLL